MKNSSAIQITIVNRRESKGVVNVYEPDPKHADLAWALQLHNEGRFHFRVIVSRSLQRLHRNNRCESEEKLKAQPTNRARERG